MYISGDNLFFIGCGICLFISGIFTNFFISIFDVSYVSSFLICCILLVVMLFIGLILISNKVWYKELTDYSYYSLNKVYERYKVEVIKNKKTYIRFVDDYVAENRNTTFILDPRNNTIVPVDNAKNKVISQVIDLLKNRVDIVNRYFCESSFRYSDYMKLMREYNTTSVMQDDILSGGSIKQLTSENIDEKLFRVKSEILKYEYGEKTPKHYGHRMFGYLLQEKYFNALNDEQRLEAWQKFTGLQSKPEMDYLRRPDSNKNSVIKIDKQLKEIADIFTLIGLKITVTYHNKELHRKK